MQARPDDSIALERLPTARGWVATAVPLLVLAVITLVPADRAQLEATVFVAGGGFGLVLLVFGPVVVAGRRDRQPDGRRAVPVAVAVLALMIISNALPVLPVLAEFDGSWQAKLLNLCWLAILLAGWPAGRRTAGLVVRLEPGSARPVLIVAAVACLVWLGLGVLGAWAGLIEQPSASLLWYQLLLPGIDEELIFRGVLLALLTAGFGLPWRFLGVRAGWGLVAVTILFGVLHGIAVIDGRFTLNVLAAVLTTPVGLLLAWIRLRSGSIWPAVLTHNAINTAHLLGTFLI